MRSLFLLFSCIFLPLVLGEVGSISAPPTCFPFRFRGAGLGHFCSLITLMPFFFGLWRILARFFNLALLRWRGNFKSLLLLPFDGYFAALDLRCFSKEVLRRALLGDFLVQGKKKLSKAVPCFPVFRLLLFLLLLLFRLLFFLS